MLSGKMYKSASDYINTKVQNSNSCLCLYKYQSTKIILVNNLHITQLSSSPRYICYLTLCFPFRGSLGCCRDSLLSISCPVPNCPLGTILVITEMFLAWPGAPQGISQISVVQESKYTISIPRFVMPEGTGLILFALLKSVLLDPFVNLHCMVSGWGQISFVL